MKTMSKSAKKFFATAVCMSMLLIVFVGCNQANGGATGQKKPTEQQKPNNPQKPGEQPKSAEKQLLEFKLEAAHNPGLAADVVGTINEVLKNITVIVPHGTDVTKLKATFVVSKGASVFAKKVLQQSGVTENDFTYPFRFYKVVAEDGSAQEYMVQIEATPASGYFTGNKLGAFDFRKDINPGLSEDVFGSVGTITDPKTLERKNVVFIKFPIGTTEATIRTLKPTFAASFKAKVFIGSTELKSAETAADFYNLTDGTNLTVTSEAGNSTKYNVAVEIDLPKAPKAEVEKYFGSYKGTVPGLGETMVVLAWDRITLYSTTMSMYYENMEWEKQSDNTYTCTAYKKGKPQIKNLYGKTGYDFTEEGGVITVKANIMGISTTATKQAIDFVWTPECGYKKAKPM